MNGGEGQSRRDGILQLSSSLSARGMAFLAPGAEGGSWYPNSFLTPRDTNQPLLDSALAVVEETIEMAEKSGVPRERIGHTIIPQEIDRVNAPLGQI